MQRSSLLKYRAQDIYRLVGDIEAYPHFVPGCVSATVERSDGAQVRARLGFRVKGLSDSFATENLHDDGHRIHMRLLDGPFRSLQGHWHFQPLGETACKVSLRIDLDFGNRLMEATLGPWIDRAVGSVMDAFRLRAESLYGRA
ncbi:MAG: type II toxin-antitoxin system RatA family toxin [Solimonas sp.]